MADSYFAPFIDNDGMHIPSYNAILGDLIDKMKNIFGSDIYIDEDTMDYQQIAIFAKMLYDSYNLALLSYNNRVPLTATGVGLDNAVSLAGIKRKPATKSTCVVTITGSAGTIINEGEVQDTNGNVWQLPAEVVIPENGIIDVSVSALLPGGISAAANTITTIVTPVYGWDSVTNQAPSSTGADIETDFELRGRYALATLAPSSSIFEGIYQSLQSIENVTRVRGYENDTGSVSDGNTPKNVPSGIPPHSVSFVVEGGNNVSIAEAIYYKKTPGCGTYGTTSVPLISTTGNTFNINFFRPSYNNLYVRITLKPLPGYAASYYVPRIYDSVKNYVRDLQIGDNVYRSIIWSIASDAMDDRGVPTYSIQNVEFSTDNAIWNTQDFVVNPFGAAKFVDLQVVTTE